VGQRWKRRKLKIIKHTNEQQLILETKNGKTRSNGKPSVPRAEEGYFNEESQSGPSTHKATKPKIHPKLQT
jgi:hypothetical protein